MDRGSEATRSWTSQDRRLLSKGHESPGNLEAESVSTAGGFSHEATIVRGPEAHPLSESESVVRARLREVPMIYILFLAMATFYRVVVLGNDDLVIYYVELVVTSCLVGTIALLSSRVPVSLVRLRPLERGMLAIFPCRNVVVE